MGAVIVAARYVPRPPDDNIWSFWSPPRSVELTLRPVAAAPFLPNWQQHQAFFNDQGNNWNWWTPPRQRESVLDLVGGNYPFKPRWQRQQAFYNDAGNEWRAAPVGMPPVFRVAVAAPFTPQWQRQQRYYADAGSEWQSWYPNRAREPVLDLVGGNFPLKPIWQRQQFFYADAGNEWQSWTPNRARESVLDLVGGNFPFVGHWRRLEQYDDPPPWRFQPQPVPAVFGLAIAAPFTAQWRQQQRFYADAGSEWQSWYPNRARESVLDLVGGNFPFKARWQRHQAFYNDQGNLWNAKPRAVNAVIQIVPAPLPFRPNYAIAMRGYDERSLWTHGTPRASLQLILPNVVIVDVSGYLLATERPDTARFVVAGPAAGPDDLQYGWPNVIVRRRL